MIIDKLIEKIEQTGNPTVVGLDPRLNFIPDEIKQKKYAKYGKTPKAAAKAMYSFNKAVIDEVYDLIPAVKPQIAMYERYGIEGLKCYAKTCEYARKKGLIVIGDIKRSDIASTAEAYSDGHIGMADVEGERFEMFKHDFITLNPYLGSDSITPFLKDCREYDKGLFVLAKTSNPNSAQTQDIVTEDGSVYYEKIGSLISEWGKDFIGQKGYSSVGAVVGATHPAQAKKLREIMPHTFFLVPGYGAQGGKAEDLAVCFDKNGIGAIVNSSRGIIAAHTKEQYKELAQVSFAKASRQAVIDMKNDLRRFI